MNTDLRNVLVTGFFNKDEVKRHVYVELMTLKTLLIAKGIITQEEFDTTRQVVDQRITKEICDQIDQMAQNNPKEATAIKLLSDLFSGLKKG
jgi:hypothetical protein